MYCMEERVRETLTRWTRGWRKKDQGNPSPRLELLAISLEIRTLLSLKSCKGCAYRTLSVKRRSQSNLCLNVCSRRKYIELTHSIPPFFTSSEDPIPLLACKGSSVQPPLHEKPSPAWIRNVPSYRSQRVSVSSLLPSRFILPLSLSSTSFCFCLLGSRSHSFLLLFLSLCVKNCVEKRVRKTHLLCFLPLWTQPCLLSFSSHSLPRLSSFC